MLIRSATFIKSSQKVNECPQDQFPEFAFIGRSNVGKSSLINMLTGRKSLAKTSTTPGKTQLINHYLINENWYLVDLPGLGYARVAQSSRMQWEKMISSYLTKRNTLLHTFVLIDIRLKPQGIDLDLMDALQEAGIPFSVVFTKTDKLSRNENARNLSAYSDLLKKRWGRIPECFMTSCANKTGGEKVLEKISSLIPLR